MICRSATGGLTSLRMVRGLEAVKRCKTVYLEAYTSVLLVPKEKLVGVTVRLNTTKQHTTVYRRYVCRKSFMAKSLWLLTENLLKW